MSAHHFFNVFERYETKKNNKDGAPLSRIGVQIHGATAVDDECCIFCCLRRRPCSEFDENRGSRDASGTIDSNSGGRRGVMWKGRSYLSFVTGVWPHRE